MDRQPGVYVIKCKETNELYIGSAVNLIRRVKEHIYDLNHGVHANPNLQAEWERYTQDGFEFSVVEHCERELVRVREQHWIDELKPTLNIQKIVEHPGLGVERTPETRARLRKAAVRQHSKLTPEQKTARREAVSAGWQEWWDSLTDEERDGARKRRSNPHTEATKAILRAKSTGNKNALGHVKSAAAIEKMSAASQAHWDKTAADRAAKKAEWEAGSEQREQARREKLSKAHKGRVVSDETKAKLRAAALAQQADPDYRAKHAAGLAAAMRTPEMRAKLSAAHQGKTLTAEHKANIGASHAGRKHTEETKRRMSEALKAAWVRRKNIASE